MSNSIDGAISAARAARDAEDAERVAKGEGLTSLNRMLQWGAANSSGPDAASAAAETQKKRTPEQLKEDRAWLDAAFPDMFDNVKKLTALLSGRPVSPDDPEPEPLSIDERVEALESLEEYMADLNYAINIAKLGTLETVVDHASHQSPRVRAASLWVLGTAMQDFAEAKEQIVDGGGIPPIVAGLRDADNVAPRAKAAMAVSALLKHAGESTRKAFESAGGMPFLLACLYDEAPSVRRRIQFMLQHAHTVGLDWVGVAALADAETVGKIVTLLDRTDPSETALLEAAVGALGALVALDRIKLLDRAPTLPGVLSKLSRTVPEKETRKQLDALSEKLTSSISGP